MVSKIQVSPYSTLAPIYDHVMLHVDYKKWASYIIKIIHKFAKHSRTILDVSCGTGSCCYHLKKSGFYVVGMDAAFPMVQQAHLKYRNLNIPFLCADMQYPALRPGFDVIISLYDSMNYLLSEQSWNICLDHLYVLLNRHGLLIFDVSTVHNSKTDFSQYVQKEELNRGSYKRSSWFDTQTLIQTNQFEISYNDTPQKIFCETHQQKIRYLDDIKHMVSNSAFEYVNAFKDFTFQPHSERCERVHFVLRKS